MGIRDVLDPAGVLDSKSERDITEIFEKSQGDFLSEKIRLWFEGLFDEDQQPLTIQRQGSNIEIPIVYGTREIGGVIVDRNVTDGVGGVFNEYLHLLVVWCAGEIDSVDELFFDEYKEGDQRFNKEGGGKWFTVTHHLGSDTQAVDPDVLANFNNATAESRLRSVAYSYIRLEQDENQTVWRGIPKITARIKGRKVYDPRTTLTEYSENPALCVMDYLKDTIFSKGLVDNDLVIQSFIDSANYADEQEDSNISVTETTQLYPGDTGYPLPPGDPNYGRPITVTNNTNEFVQVNRFTMNHLVDTNKTIFDNVGLMLRQFRGFMILENGKLKLINEGAGDPVMIFDASNIVGNVQSQGPRKRSRLNRCQVEFTNKRNRYKKDIVSYPATSDPLYAQWLDEDNGVSLDKKLTYQGITEKAEALRMAETAVKVSRENGTCTFTATYLAIKLQAADIIGVTDETRGWIEKPFRVSTLQQRPDGLVKVSCVEHNSTAYPWEGLDYDDEIGGSWLGDPNNILAPDNLLLTLDETLATLGVLSWTYNTDGFVRYYRIDIVRDSDGEIIISKEERAKSTSLPLISVGAYTIKVYAVSTTGHTSAPATLVLNAQLPAPPDGINLTPGDFDTNAEPFFLSGDLILGNQFEFGLGSTDVVTRGATAVFTGLQADTQYTVYARTVNAFGVSAWINASVSTTDGQKIIDIVGEIDLSALEDIKPDWATIVESVSDVFGDEINSIENLVNEKNIEIESKTRNEQIAQLNLDLSVLSDDLDTLNTVTIPQINSELSDNTIAINELNTVTIPQINSDLAQLDSDLSQIDDRFPIQTVDISDDSISTPKLQANSVTAVKIIAGAISAEKILAGAITTDKMFVNSINGDRILVNTLNANKIVAESITANEIAANTITGDKILVNSVNADRLIAFSITANEIDSNAVTADKITANAVVADKIAADAVIAEKIASDTILTRHLLADQIEGVHIKAATIAALNLIAGTITGDKIAANTVTAGNILVNSLLADEIFAENITATGTISGAYLTGTVIAAFGDVTNTIPMYSESAFSGGLLGGGAIRGDYSGSGFFNDSPSGGSVIGNYTGTDTAATAVKGVGGAGRAGVFYTNSNQTCVYINGGFNRALLINNSSGFTCAHFEGATDIGALIDSTGATTSPSQAGLKVLETSAFAGVRSQGGTWDFYADNGSGSYGPFTGGHDGLVLKTFTAEQGDIVCDGDLIASNGVSDAILSMELSSAPMQKSCAGVFVLQHELNETNRPAAMKGLDLDDYSQYDAITFNALGEGMLNVCGEGGNIEKGDYICTSSIAGKGTKQPNPDDLKSYTVAQARENVIFSSTTEVKQIAVFYKAG
jgi:hypothetical protein